MTTYIGWKQIGERLGVSPRTARRWEHRYGLPVSRNHRVRITERRLTQWPIECVEQGAPLPPRVWIAVVRPLLILSCDFAEVYGRVDLARGLQMALESVPQEV